MLCFTSLFCNSDTSFDQVIPPFWVKIGFTKGGPVSNFSVSLASALKESGQNDAQ
jgi:hypothetical protein